MSVVYQFLAVLLLLLGLAHVGIAIFGTLHFRAAARDGVDVDEAAREAGSTWPVAKLMRICFCNGVVLLVLAAGFAA